MGESRTAQIAPRLAVLVGKWRRDAGLNQFEAAERIGVDRVTYQRLESGFNDSGREQPTNPTLSTLLGIASAMDRPLPELIADLMFDPPGSNMPPE